jgi:hypothetical protein
MIPPLTETHIDGRLILVIRAEADSSTCSFPSPREQVDHLFRI